MTAQTAPQAINLAWSYISDTDRALTEAQSDDIPVVTRQALETLSLAARQLDNAAQMDPTATVEVPDSDGEMFAPTQNDMRAAALSLEGRALHMRGSNKDAVKVLKQAVQYNPSLSAAYAELAQSYIALGHRDLALKNAQQALALQPDDIEYMKLVDRLSAASPLAVNVSGFKGSWKVLLFLIGFGLVAVVQTLLGEGQPGTPFIAIMFLGGAVAYWRWRR